MNKDEALKLALEALELLTGAWQTFDALDYGDNAIAAIKEALAQPEQKPMHPELRKMYEDYFDKCFRESSALDAAVQAEREACAKVCDDMVLYTGYDCAAAIRARGQA
jgi:hypothetical protein